MARFSYPVRDSENPVDPTSEYSSSESDISDVEQVMPLPHTTANATVAKPKKWPPGSVSYSGNRRIFSKKKSSGTARDLTSLRIFASKTGDCNFDPELLKKLSSGSVTDSTRSKFWKSYKRTADKFDQQFVDRLETNIDISMLFAGLFSAVNTAFIIAVQSNIVIVNASIATIANVANAGGLGLSPVWTIALSYASLSSSLLAALGTLLAKQWLAHFKATRLTYGSLSSRGIHRQRKFDALQSWYFNAILDCFPLLLQGSLLLFAISLLGSTWYPYYDVAGIILAATGGGVTLFLATLFSAILAPDSPFHTPLLHLPKLFLRCGAQLAQLLRHLRAPCFRSGVKLAPFRIPTLSEEAPAVHWLLKISTEPNVVAQVARMVPEVDWPVDFDVSRVAKSLWGTFRSYFTVKSNDPKATSLTCSNVDKAYACAKALFHLYAEALHGGTKPPPDILKLLKQVQSCLSSTEFSSCGTQEPRFIFICALISSAISEPAPSTIVPNEELSWVSHIIPAFLHSTSHNREAWLVLATSVVPKFTLTESMPSKVLANHWTIIALIIGIPIRPNDLVKVDKSSAVARLREEVCGSVEPKSLRRTTVVQKALRPGDFALALDLILRVLSVERDRGMIAGCDLGRWIAGLFERLTTEREDDIWEEKGCYIIKVMSRTVSLRSLVNGTVLRSRSKYIYPALKHFVALEDVETVALILPLWLDAPQESVDHDLCMNVITLLLGRHDPRSCHVASPPITGALNPKDELGMALRYMRVVATMADNTSFHTPLVSLGHMQKCMDILLDTHAHTTTTAVAGDTADAVHREHAFLLLSIVTSIRTCSSPNCRNTSVHPSALIAQDYPLAWPTIISALEYIQHAGRDELDVDRISRIAGDIEPICRRSQTNDVSMGLRRIGESIAARIRSTVPSALDEALVRLLRALGSANMSPATSQSSSRTLLVSHSGGTSACRRKE